ncbi:MAG: hypothetical protein ACK6DE_03335, partial [Pseudanabaena sp.]
ISPEFWWILGQITIWDSPTLIMAKKRSLQNGLNSDRLFHKSWFSGDRYISLFLLRSQNRTGDFK